MYYSNGSSSASTPTPASRQLTNFITSEIVTNGATAMWSRPCTDAHMAVAKKYDYFEAFLTLPTGASGGGGGGHHSSTSSNNNYMVTSSYNNTNNTNTTAGNAAEGYFTSLAGASSQHQHQHYARSGGGGEGVGGGGGISYNYFTGAAGTGAAGNGRSNSAGRRRSGANNNNTNNHNTTSFYVMGGGATASTSPIPIHHHGGGGDSPTSHSPSGGAFGTSPPSHLPPPPPSSSPTTTINYSQGVTSPCGKKGAEGGAVPMIGTPPRGIHRSFSPPTSVAYDLSGGATPVPSGGSAASPMNPANTTAIHRSPSASASAAGGAHGGHQSRGDGGGGVVTWTHITHASNNSPTDRPLPRTISAISVQSDTSFSHSQSFANPHLHTMSILSSGGGGGYHHHHHPEQWYSDELERAIISATRLVAGRFLHDINTPLTEERLEAICAEVEANTAAAAASAAAVGVTSSGLSIGSMSGGGAGGAVGGAGGLGAHLLTSSFHGNSPSGNAYGGGMGGGGPASHHNHNISLSSSSAAAMSPLQHQQHQGAAEINIIERCDYLQPGMTPLMVAVAMGLDKVVEVMLRELRASAHTQNPLTGETAVHVACRYGRAHILHKILLPLTPFWLLVERAQPQQQQQQQNHSAAGGGGLSPSSATHNNKSHCGGGNVSAFDSANSQQRMRSTSIGRGGGGCGTTTPSPSSAAAAAADGAHALTATTTCSTATVGCVPLTPAGIALKYHHYGCINALLDYVMALDQPGTKARELLLTAVGQPAAPSASTAGGGGGGAAFSATVGSNEHSTLDSPTHSPSPPHHGHGSGTFSYNNGGAPNGAMNQNQQQQLPSGFASSNASRGQSPSAGWGTRSPGVTTSGAFGAISGSACPDGLNILHVLCRRSHDPHCLALLERIAYHGPSGLDRSVVMARDAYNRTPAFYCTTPNASRMLGVILSGGIGFSPSSSFSSMSSSVSNAAATREAVTFDRFSNTPLHVLKAAPTPVPEDKESRGMPQRYPNGNGGGSPGQGGSHGGAMMGLGSLGSGGLVGTGLTLGLGINGGKGIYNSIVSGVGTRGYATIRRSQQHGALLGGSMGGGSESSHVPSGSNNNSGLILVNGVEVEADDAFTISGFTRAMKEVLIRRLLQDATCEDDYVACLTSLHTNFSGIPVLHAMLADAQCIAILMGLIDRAFCPSWHILTKLCQAQDGTPRGNTLLHVCAANGYYDSLQLLFSGAAIPLKKVSDIYLKRAQQVADLLTLKNGDGLPPMFLTAHCPHQYAAVSASVLMLPCLELLKSVKERRDKRLMAAVCRLFVPILQCAGTVLHKTHILHYYSQSGATDAFRGWRKTVRALIKQEAGGIGAGRPAEDYPLQSALTFMATSRDHVTNCTAIATCIYQGNVALLGFVIRSVLACTSCEVLLKAFAESNRDGELSSFFSSSAAIDREVRAGTPKKAPRFTFPTPPPDQEQIDIIHSMTPPEDLKSSVDVTSESFANFVIPSWEAISGRWTDEDGTVAPNQSVYASAAVEPIVGGGGLGGGQLLHDDAHPAALLVNTSQDVGGCEEGIEEVGAGVGVESLLCATTPPEVPAVGTADIGSISAAAASAANNTTTATTGAAARDLTIDPNATSYGSISTTMATSSQQSHGRTTSTLYYYSSVVHRKNLMLSLLEKFFILCAKVVKGDQEVIALIKQEAAARAVVEGLAADSLLFVEEHHPIPRPVSRSFDYHLLAWPATVLGKKEINIYRRAEYLSDSEFASIFGVDKPTYAAWPEVRQVYVRSQLKLTAFVHGDKEREEDRRKEEQEEQEAREASERLVAEAEAAANGGGEAGAGHASGAGEGGGDSASSSRKATPRPNSPSPPPPIRALSSSALAASGGGASLVAGGGAAAPPTTSAGAEEEIVYHSPPAPRASTPPSSRRESTNTEAPPPFNPLLTTEPNRSDDF